MWNKHHQMMSSNSTQKQGWHHVKQTPSNDVIKLNTEIRMTSCDQVMSSNEALMWTQKLERHVKQTPSNEVIKMNTETRMTSYEANTIKWCHQMTSSKWTQKQGWHHVKQTPSNDVIKWSIDLNTETRITSCEINTIKWCHQMKHWCEHRN